MMMVGETFCLSLRTGVVNELCVEMKNTCSESTAKVRKLSTQSVTVGFLKVQNS